VPDIAADLFAEGFGVGPAHLGAQPLEEAKGDGRLLGEGLISFKGVEVEQVGFDREGVCAEGGAIADVGHGVKGFTGGACADGQRGDVDAVGG
jgi:hypothetical protein